MDTKPTRKLVTHLMSIKQGANKPLNEYIRRFDLRKKNTHDGGLYMEQSIIRMILISLCLGSFKWAMAQNTWKTLVAMIEKL